MDEHQEKFANTTKLAAVGRISLRDFVQLGIAAGLTAAASEISFVQAARAEGKRGGVARFCLGGATTDILDPATYSTGFTQTVFWGALSNSLTEVDAKGEVKPDLAESFETEPGAKKWVFKLKRGATFHNGKTVTAEDVVASLQHHMGEKAKSAVKSVLAVIEDMKADGPETVVFTLSSGNADFPNIMSDYHLPIMPAVDGKADWQSGVRTGAFSLKSWEPGVSGKVKRNPNYHKENRPFLDEAEFLVIQDVTARMNALSTGSIDYVDRPDLKTLDLLKRNPDLAILELAGSYHCTLPMNVTVPPFDNKDVRLALKWAIDREEIVRKIFLGHARPGNDNPISMSVKFAIDPQPIFKLDPDRARHHLKQAGMENLSVELSMAETAFVGALDAGALIRESAAKCGIDVKVIREANDSYWDNVWMKKPWCASNWFGRPTVDWMFSTAYAADAAWNDTFWKNLRFNELLLQARAEIDEAKRSAMYAEMQQINHDDNGNIVLVFTNYVYAHSKKLAHGEVATNYPEDGLRITERWWMA